MKRRSGFVSNSSSSSFIIQWKCNVSDHDGDVDSAVGFLFEEPEYKYAKTEDPKGVPRTSLLVDPEGGTEESLIDEEVIDKAMNDPVKEVMDEISRSTKVIGRRNDMLESTFHTIMRNETMDYGHAAQSLLMALTVDEVENGRSRYEIIHIRTEDGGW